MKKLRKMAIGLMVSMLALTITACGSSGQNVSGSVSKGKVVIGGKDFTEQRILPEITSIYLKENGYDTKVSGNMGSTVVRTALENGQIDLYWEYTGTALVVFNKQTVETDPDKAFQKVQEIDSKKQLAWLNKTPFNDTFAILMRADEANKLGFKSISDLANYVNANPNKLKFGTDAEFYARKDGLPGLEKLYGFSFNVQNVVRMDAGLVYNALNNSQIDIAMGLSTDGRIKGLNLVVLNDDRKFFPAYNAAPVVRQAVLDQNPELKTLLNNISSRLDDNTITELNYEVDGKHEDVAKVARDWLVKEQLIKQ